MTKILSPKPRLFLMVLISLLSFKTAFAGVTVKESTSYYNVKGKNGAQIFRSIRSQSLKLKSGRHTIANTKIFIDINSQTAPTIGGGCKFIHGGISLKLKYTYPAWKQKKQATKRTQNAWDRFISHVKLHEMKHGRIARQYARELDLALSRQNGKTAKNCKAQLAQLRSIFSQIKKKYTRLHTKFDNEEGRGKAPIRRVQKILLTSN